MFQIPWHFLNIIKKNDENLITSGSVDLKWLFFYWKWSRYCNCHWFFYGGKYEFVDVWYMISNKYSESETKMQLNVNRFRDMSEKLQILTLYASHSYASGAKFCRNFNKLYSISLVIFSCWFWILNHNSIILTTFTCCIFAVAYKTYIMKKYCNL